VTDDYGLNVGQFLRDHPQWVITAGPEGSGYTARRKDALGRPGGPRYSALTLDELAAKIGASGGAGTRSA
jgi:hypothetical protein